MKNVYLQAFKAHGSANDGYLSAIERNTGARGLRSIIEDIMRDIMFDVPSNMRIEKCIITRDTVEKKAPPVLELCKESEVDPKRGIIKKRKTSPVRQHTETA